MALAILAVVFVLACTSLSDNINIPYSSLNHMRSLMNCLQFLARLDYISPIYN
nr:MAG TPA: hypothetical protein [Caudoviricetes sp.]